MHLRSLLLVLVLICFQLSKADNFVWYDGKQSITYSLAETTSPVVDVALKMFTDDLKQVTGMLPEKVSVNKASIRIIEMDRITKKEQHELQK